MKNKNKTYIPIVWSETDFLLLDDYDPLWVENNKASLGKLLYKHGMNIVDYPVSIIECWHYPRSQPTKKVFGRMFSGAERLDNKWNETGCMSLEAVVVSMDDPEIRKDLIEMATTVRFDE